ncbi:Asp23/Gls24 family envelope stress response protein [Sinobaca sp. H24]|uniref:Asp23/Gls24 family envelope stress response protein n=1 Tax=Sinobaca sp. H24 TaxID=2923376 RepID=UPI0020798A5D|nr:Asp23/Gls24 family envelope stress response protein [Sinobaca sp. H24]
MENGPNGPNSENRKRSDKPQRRSSKPEATPAEEQKESADRMGGPGSPARNMEGRTPVKTSGDSSSEKKENLPAETKETSPSSSSSVPAATTTSSISTTTPSSPPSSTSILIDEEVVKKIAAVALMRVDGIVGMSGGIVEGITDRLGSGNLTKGVSAEVGKTQAALDVNIIVEYDKSIPAIFEEVQTHVAHDIERMTGLEIVEINLTVDDIDKAGDEKLSPPEEEPKNTAPPRVQ